MKGKEMTLDRFTNAKIGTKLAVAIGGAIILLIGMAAMAFWGLETINAANEAAQQQARLMLLGQRVSGDVDGVVVRIANAVITRKAGTDDQTRIAMLRKVYLGAIEELRSLSRTAE